MPWDQALYVILKTHGLGAELDGRPWEPVSEGGLISVTPRR